MSHAVVNGQEVWWDQRWVGENSEQQSAACVPWRKEDEDAGLRCGQFIRVLFGVSVHGKKIAVRCYHEFMGQQFWLQLSYLMHKIERLLESPLLSGWGAGVSEDDQGREDDEQGAGEAAQRFRAQVWIRKIFQSHCLVKGKSLSSGTRCL